MEHGYLPGQKQSGEGHTVSYWHGGESDDHTHDGYFLIGPSVENIKIVYVN